MSWRARTAPSAGAITLSLDEGERAMSRADVLAALTSDAAFRGFLAETLAALPFEAFFFETPPTTLAAQREPFEAAILDAPALRRVRADRRDFDALFAKSPEADVIAFPNLGGDATLVVPTPRSSPDAYGHLGAFVRLAPRSQVDALLARLGREVTQHLSSAPLWVSTAGLGVPWLHVRLDQRPKYYRHAPYKRPAPAITG